jgi:hypothetical protein
MTPTKFCVQCSKAVLPGMLICPGCGGRAFGAAPRPAGPAVPRVPLMPPAIVTTQSRSWRTRGPLLALAVFCLLAGIGALFESARSVTSIATAPAFTPDAGGGLVDLSTRTLRTAASPLNGINFAAGLMLCLAGLLALNRAMPGTSRDGGAVDRGLARISVLGGRGPAAAVPALIALVSVVWLGYLLAARTDVHWSPTAAAEAFKRDVPSYDLAVTGHVMYARAFKGPVTHVAHFTPALVRALDRAQIGGIGGRIRKSEYPLPGVVPLLTFAGLAVFAFLKRRRGTWRPVSPGGPDTMAARAFLLFALLNLYVVTWIVLGQGGGVVFADVNLRPVGVGWVLFMLIAGFSAVAVIHRKVEANRLPYAARASWLSLFFAVSLAAPLWAYYFSDIELGSPALLWLLAYAAAGSLCWLAIDPDSQGGQP